MTAWYDDRRNLAAVARHMGERGDSVGDVAYMLEKPEKFSDDWLAASIALDDAQRADEDEAYRRITDDGWGTR